MSGNPARNVFRIGEDDIIYAEYVGDQTFETVKEAQRQTEILIKNLRAQNKRVLLLGDVSKMGKQDMAVRKATYEVFTQMDYDKIAFWGPNYFISGLVNLIIKGTGKTSKIRVFRGQEEAVGWLKS